MKTLIYVTSLLIIAPVFLFGDIITVDKNGSGDYYTIQEGINNANAGDTVLVYPGTYVEIVDFSGKDIVVAGLFLTTQDSSYISQTVIDGNMENCPLVRFTNGETENAKLIGFTITNASESSGNFEKSDYQGLGIYIKGSSPVIESNRIINNSHNTWYVPGGGIFIENSSAKIINNTINHNDMACLGGGIYINNSTDVLVENNIIDANMVSSGYGEAFGAGIYIDSSQYITVKNNTICNNYNNFGYGGAIYVLQSDNVEITNNNISGNITGGYGGAVYAAFSTNINIIGNLFYNNRADLSGGGMFCDNSEMLMVNNTICFNAAESNYGKGGGIYCIGSNPDIYNTILFYNTAGFSGNQVFLDADSDPDFFYSDIEGGVSAFGLADTVTYDGFYEHNTEKEPQFVLSGEYPYSLDKTSPCIDAGDPDTGNLSIPVVDLAGNVRIINDTIDMGAYENQLVSNIIRSSKPDNVFVFPNPATGIITVRIPEKQFHKGWVVLSDMKGNPVLKIPMENSLQKYDLSFLPRGVYIIKITCGEFMNTEKIVLY